MIRCRWLLLAAPLLLAGCGPALSDTAQTHAPQAGTVPAGTTAGPPESARMICDDDIRGKIQQALHLPAPPATSDRWAGGVYTCYYTLPSGPLTLSVRVLADDHTAAGHLADEQARTTTAQPLAGLGERAYGTPNGTAEVLKDNQILTVDATALPPVFGPDQQRRADFAYEVASDVLGCWTGDG